MNGPTLKGELRRGVNAFNLSVGLVTSLAVSLLSYFVMPDLFKIGILQQSVLLGVATMILTTGLHTAGHAYFGWRFEKGVSASQSGQHEQAVRLLSVVEKKEMDHFDPHGVALQALQKSRQVLMS